MHTKGFSVLVIIATIVTLLPLAAFGGVSESNTIDLKTVLVVLAVVSALILVGALILLVRGALELGHTEESKKMKGLHWHHIYWIVVILALAIAVAKIPLPELGY